MRGALVVALSPLIQAHEVPNEQRLSTIGAAPDLALISQDGAEVTFENFRGKVVAGTFIYASCPDCGSV